MIFIFKYCVYKVLINLNNRYNIDRLFAEGNNSVASCMKNLISSVIMISTQYEKKIRKD